MGAKITVGGVQIEIDVQDLGEAMRQLAPHLEGPRPEQASAPAPVRQRSVSPKPPAVAGSPVVQQPAQAALTHVFLKSLNEHKRSGGLLSEEVMKVVGAKHTKGIGSKMTPINSELQAVGFDPASVYSNDRNDAGQRVWLAGAKIEEALAAIKDKESL